MELTGFEATLIAALVGLGGGVGGSYWSGRRKVDCAICDTRHQGLDALIRAEIGGIKEDVREIKEILRGGR